MYAAKRRVYVPVRSLRTQRKAGNEYKAWKKPRKENEESPFANEPMTDDTKMVLAHG